jgi:quinol monooxygenase YgiN
VSLHVFVRFEPKPGCADELREKIRWVTPQSRAEPGCLALTVFESVHEPTLFEICSEWVDEAAFDLHAELPHTVRFLTEAEALVTHPIVGLRARELSAPRSPSDSDRPRD